MTRRDDPRADMREWTDTLSLSRVSRQTLHWLIDAADTEYTADVTMAVLAHAMGGIKEASAYSRLQALHRLGLVILTPISTQRVKRRFLIEIRYPYSAAETQRIIQRAEFESAGTRLLEQRPAQQKRWNEVCDRLRRGVITIEDVWR